jgi:hypothetical protein
MGKTDKKSLNKFEKKDVNNKLLIIEMLKYEEQLTKSEFGQSLYKNPLNMPLVSLHVEKTLNRLTLSQFDFDTSDENVEMYRTIFRTYFKSPTDYDKDVINSVHYMRENKCVYYNLPIINIGDVIPDCKLYNYTPIKESSLYNILNNKSDYAIFGAFSLS